MNVWRGGMTIAFLGWAIDTQASTLVFKGGGFPARSPWRITLHVFWRRRGPSLLVLRRRLVKFTCGAAIRTWHLEERERPHRQVQRVDRHAFAYRVKAGVFLRRRLGEYLSRIAGPAAAPH